MDQYKIEVFDCLELDKGKGVRAKEQIEAGAFICEYMGEIIDRLRGGTAISFCSSIIY